MSKQSRGTQIEMLLPISGKKPETVIPVAPKKTRVLTYEKIVESLRKKGLTKLGARK